MLSGPAVTTCDKSVKYSEPSLLEKGEGCLLHSFVARITFLIQARALANISKCHFGARWRSQVTGSVGSSGSPFLKLPVTLKGWSRAGWVCPGALLLVWSSIHLSLYGTSMSSSLRGEKNTWVHAAGSVSIDANWLGVGGNKSCPEPGSLGGPGAKGPANSGHTALNQSPKQLKELIALPVSTIRYR